MEFNPYQSPSELASEPEPSEEMPFELRWPARGLGVLAVMTVLLWAPMSLVSVGAIATMIMDGGDAGPDWMFLGISGIVCLGMAIVNSAIVYGAHQAEQGKSYRSARTAAIIACIPIFSPLLGCGIPLGIWMLMLLRRPQVRARFGSQP